MFPQESENVLEAQIIHQVRIVRDAASGRVGE